MKHGLDGLEKHRYKCFECGFVFETVGNPQTCVRCGKDLPIA